MTKMSSAYSKSLRIEDAMLPTALDLCRAALVAVDRLVEAARYAVGKRVLSGSKMDAAALEAHQFAAHGYAWLATCAAALHQTFHWAGSLAEGGKLDDREHLILQIAFGEYLAQIAGGIAMSQTEVV